MIIVVMGVSLVIVSLSYGTWEIESIVSTAGSLDALVFLPLPMASLTYDFGK